ncbi:MAG: peptide ABC transporter substrate-binding protein, partial [Chloroflexi bacterium]|nr:peptide ABC transporter substrate-binding protein [Chloroflexota bacterium]
MKKLFLFAALVLALAVIVACAPAQPAQQVTEKVVEKVVTATPPPKAAVPKTLVVCMAQEPESLYQYGTSMFVGTLVLEAVRDTLADNYDYDFQPVVLQKLPSLKDGDAKLNKVKVKAGDAIQDAVGNIGKADKDAELDQMVVTFKLKPGIKWSDGTPLKASDSVFAYNTVKDKDSGVTSRFLLDRTVSYVAKDEVTFEWTGIPGYVDGFYFVNYFTPLPEHVLKGVAPKDIKTNPYARKPLGYGPFVVSDWVSGDRIELTKNPNYYRASEGLPKVDKLIYRFIPDTNQLTAQLIAGNCDIGTQDGLNTDVIPFFDQAEKNGLIKPYYIAGSTWEHIDFNVDPKTAPKPRPDFFSDVRVRQAVAYGTNRKDMNDKILFGKSNLMDTTAPKTHWAYPKDDSTIVKYPFDTKKAEALLDDAGWVKGADGVRAKAGQRFSITFSTTAGNKPREAVAQIFQANMKAIGIEVKLDFPPATVLFGRGKDTDYQSGNFDTQMFAWVAGVEPTLSVYICSEVPFAATAFSGQNDPRWCNKDFDKAYFDYNATLDRADKSKAAAAALSIISKELPILPLYQRINVQATNPRVLNFKPNATANELK